MDLDYLNKLSPLISAAVTVVLAVLTAVYVVHTKRLAEVTKAQATPLLVARIEPFAHRYGQFVVTNVGGGPALDVELTVALDATYKTRWRHALMEAGRRESFFFPATGGDGGQMSMLKTLAAQNRQLAYTLSYRDREGAKAEKHGELGFADLLKDWDDANWDLSPSDSEAIVNALRSGFEQVATHVSRAIADRKR